MEMGKLTAKLRDAVPVCLLVEGKEIKRYKNIEIPDEIKKLEYQDFKFDVPLNGAITFRIMFEPGVLPEVFPEIRERRTRKPFAQEVQLQDAAPAVDMAEEQYEQVTEALPASVLKAFAQALEGAQAADKMATGEAIKAEIIKVESEERLLVITDESESTEGTVDAESEAPVKKPASKGKGKKGSVPTKFQNANESK